jgi:hypothetical protein
MGCPARCTAGGGLFRQRGNRAISRNHKLASKLIENTDTERLTKPFAKIVSDKVDLVATDEHSG